MFKEIGQRIIAAVMSFTRLPMSGFGIIPKEKFERVVVLWPLVGWLTGATMAVVLWLSLCVLPLGVSVLLALLARVVLTGAMHEDGLADFCDGMGGGTTRERRLAIMKDSHIGTFGVLGLVAYALLLWSAWQGVALGSMRLYGGALLGQQPLWNIPQVAALMVAADAFAKGASAQIINLLPYARKAEEAKNRLIYKRMSGWELAVCLLAAMLPTLLLVPMHFWWTMLGSLIAALLMMLAMHRRLGGYTGDCCGACFCVSETAYVLLVLVLQGW